MAIGFLSFAIRTSGRSRGRDSGGRRASCAPSIPMPASTSMMPMERLVASTVARQRFYAVMLGVFAGVAGAARRDRHLRRARLRRGAAHARDRHPHGARRAARAGAGARAAPGRDPHGHRHRARARRRGRRRRGCSRACCSASRRSIRRPSSPSSLLFGLVATVASYLPARRATTGRSDGRAEKRIERHPSRRAGV